LASILVSIDIQTTLKVKPFAIRTSKKKLAVAITNFKIEMLLST
jgi:hypothetical protein